MTKQVKDHLKQHDVKVKDYDEVEKFLSHVSERLTVALDPHRVSDRLGQALMCSKIYIASPIIDLKAVKNEVEIAGYREAMKADGAALVRAFMWIEANAAQGITELDVDNRIRQERARCELYRGDSFHTIAGYKEHGAIVHYEASEQSASTLAPDGLLLVDTGGQYLNGTTDITRTITLGNVTAQQRHDYTLVLKGHLALARAVFPYNTYGSQLDILAHGPLWQDTCGRRRSAGAARHCPDSELQGETQRREDRNGTVAGPGGLPGCYFSAAENGSLYPVFKDGKAHILRLF